MEPQSVNNNEISQSNFSGRSVESFNIPDTSETPTVESGPAPQETDSTNNNSANQNAGMVLPKVVASPPVDNSAQASSLAQVSVPVDPTNPAVADDVDVVEKEWVDKARKIVEQTRDDPYRQEEEVEKLQIDYIKKRYGRDVKASNDT